MRAHVLFAYVYVMHGHVGVNYARVCARMHAWPCWCGLVRIYRLVHVQVRVYMWVCARVHVCACMPVLLHVGMRICVHEHVHEHGHVRTCAQVSVGMCVCAHLCVCVCVRVSARMSVCVCVYVFECACVCVSNMYTCGQICGVRGCVIICVFTTSPSV